jgi:hypothetical protein
VRTSTRAVLGTAASDHREEAGTLRRHLVADNPEPEPLAAHL